MIIVEKVTIGDREFTRTYSDSNKKISKVGTDEVYSEAYDVLDFQYEETDEDIEESTSETGIPFSTTNVLSLVVISDSLSFI